MEEREAWETFRRTGLVRDYLVYAAAASCADGKTPEAREEERDENGRPGPGGFGEAHG